MDTQLSSPKPVAVLGPDKAATDAFASQFETGKLPHKVYEIKVTPRVIEGRINPDPQVAEDLANAIEAAVNENHTEIAIACNTLQLWAEKALEILEQRRVDTKKIIIHTTFDAVMAHFLANQEEVPLWLGTTPLAEHLADDEELKTPLHIGKSDIQDQVQEIIWRTKAVVGSDYSTSGMRADQYPENPELLVERVKTLADKLLEIGKHEIIMGCTELPIAFARFFDTYSEYKERFSVFDPAQILAAQISKRRQRL